MGRWRQIAASPLALGGLSGVLTATSFRCPAVAPLVFVAFVPLMAAAGMGVRAGATAGAFMGVVGYTAVLAGLPQALVRFYAMPVHYAWVIFATGVAYHALQVVLFAAGAAAVLTSANRPREVCDSISDMLLPGLELAALWALLDWGFPKMFPWSLGGALATHSLFRQAADLGGVYGLGFLVVLVNAALAAALAAPLASRLQRRALGAALGVPLAMVAYGAWRIASLEGDRDAATSPVEMAVVQGVLPPERSYGEDAVREAWDTYERLTNRLLAREAEHDRVAAEVVVWPESTLPVYLRNNDWYRGRVERLVAQTDRPLILGAFDRSAEPPREFNSAYAFVRGSESDRPQVYHKSHLVPWAEYLPGRRWLSLLSPGRTTAEFAPGASPDSFALTLRGHGSAPLLIAPSICVEAVQAGWFNPLVRAGASLLLNITDDGWYAGSAVPDLHLQLARMRAVETRRWLVRASNSGISAFIDPTGEIVASLPFGALGTLAHAVVPSDQLTPYVRFGEWVVWLSGVIVVVGVARRLRLAWKGAAAGAGSRAGEVGGVPVLATVDAAGNVTPSEAR